MNGKRGKAEKHLLKYGSITIRDIKLPPIDSNAPNNIVKALKRIYNLKEDWITYTDYIQVSENKKVKYTGSYKRFTLEANNTIKAQFDVEQTDEVEKLGA